MDMDPNVPHGDARGAGAPAERPHLGLRYAALSDVGRVRKDNQDSGYASEHLLVIADGVGGGGGGGGPRGGRRPPHPPRPPPPPAPPPPARRHAGGAGRGHPPRP